jgi:hypothetical protein
MSPEAIGWERARRTYSRHNGGVSEPSPPGSTGVSSPQPGELRPTGRGNARLGRTIADMARSMVVVLIVVGAILLVTWRPSPEEIRSVDPTEALIAARATATYPVVYPEGLPEGWTPTSARWSLPEDAAPDPAWHVGFVTPADDYVQLGQSATTNPAYLAGITRGGSPVGEEESGWVRFESSGPQPTRSLVQVVDGVTIVVSGIAPWESLNVLAQRLSPTALPSR